MGSDLGCYFRSPAISATTSGGRVGTQARDMGVSTDDYIASGAAGPQLLQALSAASRTSSRPTSEHGRPHGATSTDSSASTMICGVALRRLKAKHSGRLRLLALGLAGNRLLRVRTPAHQEVVRQQRQQFRRPSSSSVTAYVQEPSPLAGKAATQRPSIFNDEATRYATGDFRDRLLLPLSAAGTY